MDRRNFLAATACTTIATAAYPSLAIDPLDRKLDSRLHLSLAAYSMRKYLTMKASDAESMDLLNFVEYCQKLNLPGAELTSYYFPTEVSTQYLLNLKRQCHLLGVTVSGGAIRNDFCTADPAKLEKDIAHTKRWIDYYSVLGAPAIRIFAGKNVKGEALSKTLRRCAETCKIVCDYAAEKGVILALENHGGVTAKAEDLLEIVHQVDSPAFGINFDSGNFRSTDNPYAELAMIAPYAVNAQIKVEIVNGGVKQAANLPRIVNILRAAKYSGWVALEYEAKEEPLESIPKWIEALRPLLA